MAKPIRHRGKWRIRWLDANGRRRSEVLAEYRHAVSRLAQHQHEADQIRRGLRLPDPPAKTFDDLCDYWLSKRAIHKRSRKDDESIISHHLRPAFAGQKLKAISVELVDGFVNTCGHLKDKTVHNLLTLLVSMLNLAVDLGWLIKIPRIHKPRVRSFSNDYRYLRNDEEIRRFLVAALQEGEDVFAVYSTAIYTGMRAGELAGLRWGDLDFDRRLITVQRSFDGPTKAGDVRYVPILDPLLPILREWRLQCQGEIVFPNNEGRMQGRSARIFQEVLHRVLEKAGFPVVETDGVVKRYLVFHDLRHSFASHWVLKGGDLFRLQKIMGHKSTAMTLRYSHLAPTAFASDYGRLGTHVPVEPGTVVEFKQLGSEG